MPLSLPRLTALLIAAFAAGSVAAQDAKPAAKGGSNTVATVNGSAIPKSRADAIVAEQVAQGTPDSEELRKAVREELVRREVLVQEARKKGIDKKPEVQAQIDVARQGLLIRAYLQDYLKTHPITDQAIQKEYETIKAAMGDKEYKARHVLVDSEDKAKSVIARLQKGEKFEEVAKESTDPGSKDKGGDLGWASPGSYVKPFGDALTKLEKGKFSATPVKTDFGYHVIMLEDVRPMKHPALEEVKPQLQQRLQQQMVEKHIMDLRAKAKVD
jgi:peptidyl-prolyl cis-trans isomerase C